MKSWLLALALFTAAAAQASAQETTQGQLCATVAVAPPPVGNAPSRIRSDDAEVADCSVVSKKTIAPGQAMGHGKKEPAWMPHTEFRRGGPNGELTKHCLPGTPEYICFFRENEGVDISYTKEFADFSHPDATTVSDP